MPTPVDDEKPTVVLDLNALKKQKLKQEEDLANLANELEFNAHQDEGHERPIEKAKNKREFKVILFDFQSNLFEKSLSLFPQNYEYHIARDLKELNHFLKSKNFQIVVFNYDSHPKAVNQLCSQIKQKLPTTKTIIMAKNISPNKAKAHAKTPYGATGYFQLPFNNSKIEMEFERIYTQEKKAS